MKSKDIEEYILGETFDEATRIPALDELGRLPTLS